MAINSNSRGRGALVALLAGLAALGGLMLSISGPVSADVNTVSGSGFALSATALVPLVPPTPGGAPLGVTGSATEPTDSYDTGLQTSVPVAVPGVLSVGLLEAQSTGGLVAGENHLGFAESLARAGNVVVGNILLPALQAQVIRSECRSDGDGSTGFVELVGATAGGTPLVQTPAANTPIIIGDPLAPIATAILNEQIETNVPGVETSIIVRAVHITVLPTPLAPAPVDIIIAESRCLAQGPNVLLTTTTTDGGTTTTTDGGGTTTTTDGGGTTTTTDGDGTTTTTDGGGTTTTTDGDGTTTTSGGDGTTTTGGRGPGGGGVIVGGGGGGGAQRVGTLARTGSDAQRVITLAFLALVLGGLFMLGSKGLAGGPVPAKVRSRRGPKGML